MGHPLDSIITLLAVLTAMFGPVIAIARRNEHEARKGHAPETFSLPLPDPVPDAPIVEPYCPPQWN